MIPLLGVALPPVALMPFPAISGASVSGAGNVAVTLPNSLRTIGRYSLLVTVVGSWGGSAERAGIDVLDNAGAALLSITEGSAISGSFLTASQANHNGSELVVNDPITVWGGGPIGTHTLYFLFEGIVGAASVRLRSAPGNRSNPSYFGPWSVLGIGRGRRAPPNWAALTASMTASDGYLRIICS